MTALDRVEAFCDKLPAEGDAIAGFVLGGVAYSLTAADLREVVLAARTAMNFRGDAYASGWCDAIAAIRMPGWVEREAAWRTYSDAADAIVKRAARP